MKPALTTFWAEVRQELLPTYGQEAGKRDSQKMRRRNDLAEELGLNARTLKGFLNGNQKSLGEDARRKLFDKMPALERRYHDLVGRPGLQPERPDVATGRNELYIQLTLQFEGSGEPPQMLTARLPPGREGVLTLKIDSGRIA